MKIALGADHAGIDLKNVIAAWLTELGHDVRDLGTHDRASADYPRHAFLVADEVTSGRVERGLLFCGSGVGMAMAANRRRGVRAVNCHDVHLARLSRWHNDANVLTMGGRIVAPDLAKAVIAVWLDTSYEGGRHQRRIDLLDGPRS